MVARYTRRHTPRLRHQPFRLWLPFDLHGQRSDPSHFGAAGRGLTLSPTLQYDTRGPLAVNISARRPHGRESLSQSLRGLTHRDRDEVPPSGSGDAATGSLVLCTATAHPPAATGDSIPLQHQCSNRAARGGGQRSGARNINTRTSPLSSSPEILTVPGVIGRPAPAHVSSRQRPAPGTRETPCHWQAGDEPKQEPWAKIA